MVALEALGKTLPSFFFFLTPCYMMRKFGPVIKMNSPIAEE